MSVDLTEIGSSGLFKFIGLKSVVFPAGVLFPSGNVVYGLFRSGAPEHFRLDFQVFNVF